MAGFQMSTEALVHPTPRKRKLLQQDPGAAVNAWALGLWYPDLIILNICAYNGRYSNRLVGGWHGDEITKVPGPLAKLELPLNPR
jgi:hypothetical protein